MYLLIGIENITFEHWILIDKVDLVTIEKSTEEFIE
jgi:hypothetical protein